LSHYTAGDIRIYFTAISLCRHITEQFWRLHLLIALYLKYQTTSAEGHVRLDLLMALYLKYQTTSEDGHVSEVSD